MPLMKGKSHKAFEHNIKAEMEAGKPMNQSLAIAYAMKKKAKKMSEGGMVGHPRMHDGELEDLQSIHEEDILERIMKKREHHYSEGGQVANYTPPISKSRPNEFDELVLGDDLESTYGDDNNSGDMSGNTQETQDREDMIARIMKKRGAQHNPRPA